MDVGEIKEIIERENVRFVFLQFTDILGILKSVEIAVSELDEALERGVGFDGSSIEGFVRIQESDMLLIPDLDTFAVLPWTYGDGKAKAARFICDIYTSDGRPFEGDPRYVLKRALERAREKGFEFHVGPEMEFFIFPKDGKGRPVVETIDKGGYFDLDPVDRGLEVRTEIIEALQEMGFAVEATHHEVAPSQYEVDFKHDDALVTADRVVTLKYVSKVVANKFGYHLTFMPKPIAGINGSGMHLHLSLFKDGKNAFYDPRGPYGGLSGTALNFIGGILAHAEALTAITSPLVNSYKRLVPGYEAPVYVIWGLTNRSALVRVPAPRGQATRIEYRSPDPSANPYLAFAAVLAAGLDGIEKGIDPGEPAGNNVYVMTPEERRKMGIKGLPTNLKEAIDALLADSVVSGVLGSHVLERFVEAKLKEWREYNYVVHRWEIEKYLEVY